MSSASDTDNVPSASDKGTEEEPQRPILGPGSKRALMTRDKAGNVLSEKKLRRLEKNRLSARECRRRKREATENLERQINMLEGENLRLRLQLQIGEEAEESMRQEQEKVTEGLVKLMESGASEAEVWASIEEFKEKFADYGRDRRSAIEFHLRNVERLLMPSQTTSVAMRALQGGDDKPPASANQQPAQVPPAQPTPAVASSAPPATVSSSAATTTGVPPTASILPKQDPKALFQFLVNHLKVTPEQAAALKDSRFVAQELDSHLESSLSVLEELRTRLTQCGEDLEAEFDNVRSILTPTQAAKFLVWVANNGACMHMLNELWNRVYPQTAESPRVQSDSPVDPQMEGSDSP